VRARAAVAIVVALAAALPPVVEAIVAPTPAAAVPTTFTASLVATRDTAAYSPPSPDPSGITYLPAQDRLLISDGEVDEVSIFRGANLYRTTRLGALDDTGVTTAYSHEPTGLGYDATAARLFVSDDDQAQVFIVNAGADGRFGTADDPVTSFDTGNFGNSDPEGTTYDSDAGVAFTIDGNGKEVYRIQPNANGFNGTPAAGGDDTVTHFDVAQFGAGDPEGVVYDGARDVLLVLDHTSETVYELTTSGTLLRRIDIRAAVAS
jgi:uncharacterized protein YjiK